MNKEENMEREIDESFLDKRMKENAFAVPKNYFNDLEEQILAVSKIPSAQAKISFKTPENYFGDLNDKVLSQISIAQHSEENNFEVPDLYFDKLSSNILSKTKEQKVKTFRFSAVKYAAAAMIVLTTTFGAYFYNTNNSTVSDKLASIPEEEISDYLKFYTDPNDVSFIIESTDDFSFIEEEFTRKIIN